jgi:hypothetical protein
MDALSEVLKVLQFNSAIFFNARSARLLFCHFFVDGSPHDGLVGAARSGPAARRARAVAGC